MNKFIYILYIKYKIFIYKIYRNKSFNTLEMWKERKMKIPTSQFLVGKKLKITELLLTDRDTEDWY